jgi:hypothetical protein
MAAIFNKSNNLLLKYGFKGSKNQLAGAKSAIKMPAGIKICIGRRIGGSAQVIRMADDRAPGRKLIGVPAPVCSEYSPSCQES